jgi:hypothetical protein
VRRLNLTVRLLFPSGTMDIPWEARAIAHPSLKPRAYLQVLALSRAVDDLRRGPSVSACDYTPIVFA